MPLHRRPGDFTQRAKYVGDLATGRIIQEDIDELPPMGREINPQARNASFTRQEREATGRAGARKRWGTQS